MPQHLPAQLQRNPSDHPHLFAFPCSPLLCSGQRTRESCSPQDVPQSPTGITSSRRSCRGTPVAPHLLATPRPCGVQESEWNVAVTVLHPAPLRPTWEHSSRVILSC